MVDVDGGESTESSDDVRDQDGIGLGRPGVRSTSASAATGCIAAGTGAVCSALIELQSPFDLRESPAVGRP